MITTLIVNYNNKQFLQQCIDNTVKHGHPIILVDDGSTDGSQDICKLYNSKNNIRVILNKNSIGYHNVKNVALQICQTPLLCTFETQAIAYDNLWSEVIKEFGDYREISCVYSDFDFIDIKTHNIQRVFQPSYNIHAISQGMSIPHIATYKTDYIKSIGGFKENDIQTSLELLNISIFSHIPESLYLQRGTSE